MPGATIPRYVPNRGKPDFDRGTPEERELFLQFCEYNPELICRSLAETTPENIGGLLVPNPGSRCGYEQSEEWSGVPDRGWPQAMDHVEFFYHQDKQRWAAVALPNCNGEPCFCIEELDEAITKVNATHRRSNTKSRDEYLVRHISSPGQSWYTPDMGRVIIVVASNVVPINFA